MNVRLNTLRRRLVLAFVLVSVPPMLGVAFGVGALVSSTFEANVSDWLTETARYFVSQIDEAQNDADHAAKLLAHRLAGEVLTKDHVTAFLTKDAETLAIMGFTHIAVYSADGAQIFTSTTQLPSMSVPLKSQKTILSLSSSEYHYLLNCAVVPFESPQGTAYVLVGTVLDQNVLVEGKTIKALKIRLFLRYNGAFVVLNPTGEGDAVLPPPPEVVRRLQSGEEAVPFNDPRDGIYKSLYVPINNGEKQLVGAAFIGLGSDDSFVVQISQFGIFPGIFLIGILLSVGAGVLLSRYLSMPVKALTAGVRAVTAGDYTQHVSLSGGAELSELAHGFNTMAVQLTKLRGLEESLRRQDRLSTLGEASAVIAHEVRNPLGIIKTSAEVVRNRAALRPAEVRMMDYIIDETRRIENLIHEVLDFAHPKQIIKRPVNVRKVLDGVLATAQAEFAARNVTLSFDSKIENAEISGDPDQLHQAFLNLILNALDAMPDGGTLEVTQQNVAGEHCVTFSDTGHGIASHISDRIFDPFFTTKAKGTGLGLAQVRSLVEALGGEVALVRKTTQGAAFSLSFPRLNSA